MKDVDGYDTMEEMITFRQWSLQCLGGGGWISFTKFVFDLVISIIPS